MAQEHGTFKEFGSKNSSDVTALVKAGFPARPMPEI
jgi:hypothetical protein